MPEYAVFLLVLAWVASGPVAGLAYLVSPERRWS